MDVIWQRLQDLWNAILDFSSKLVSPDWGALVGLIPIGLAALVALFFATVIVRFATAGPTRRGRARLKPVPPPGVHAATGSFAPIFGALGVFVLFAGVILGGVALVLGLTALVLTLLYWGREFMTDYEHLEAPELGRLLVPAGQGEPPPGVHMPGPSFRPILGALGTAILFFGIIFGGALFAAGLLILVIVLLGWLRDARHEYEATVEADRTGHLASGPAPRYPVGTLALITVVIAVAVTINAGWLPPTSNAGAGGGSPAPSGGTGGSGGGSAPTPATSQVTADVHIVAKDIAYQTKDVTAPAGKPFTIAFDNEDQGTPHNVDIKDPSGQDAFKGEIFPGVKTHVYDVPALSPGTYTFVCSVHPNMTGTLTVK